MKEAGPSQERSFAAEAMLMKIKIMTTLLGSFILNSLSVIDQV